jgi:hypothetical protein
MRAAYAVLAGEALSPGTLAAAAAMGGGDPESLMAELVENGHCDPDGTPTPLGYLVADALGRSGVRR